MKKSFKATILSAFIFPGLGQLYLKRYRQGLVLILIVLAGFGYLIWKATVLALNRMEGVMHSGAINIRVLKDAVEFPDAGASWFEVVIALLIICSWIVGIVDAYISGRKKDIQSALLPKR